MAAKPTTCVIGAGISGLTAGKAFSDWGLPYTCFEAATTSAATGISATRTAAPRPTSRSTSTPHGTASPSATCRWAPTSTRTTPTTAQILGIPPALRRRLLAARPDPLRDPGRARRAQGRRRLGDHPRRRVERRSSTSSSSATAITGTRAYPNFPGSFDGETIHSHHYIGPERAARPDGQARPGGRDRQQRRRHRLGALAQGSRREGLPLDPQRRLGDAQVLPGPARWTRW